MFAADSRQWSSPDVDLVSDGIPAIVVVGVRPVYGAAGRRAGAARTDSNPGRRLEQQLRMREQQGQFARLADAALAAAFDRELTDGARDKRPRHERTGGEGTALCS